MMGFLKGLIRYAVFPFLNLICVRTALEVCHALGWYPENQLARLLLASPIVLSIEWARWILVALIAGLLWAIADHFAYRRRSQTSADTPVTIEPPSPPDATPSLLRLTVGEDHSYVDYPKHNLYSQTKRYSVRLENVSPDKSVSDCKVVLTHVEPASGYRMPRLMKEGFALAAGDHIFIPLASYGEARDRVKFNCADTLVLVAGGDREMTLQFERPNALTIRATAIGSPFTELTCYTWVDPKGGFRISTAMPPEGSTVRNTERDVWLADAIWRAYLGKWERPDRNLNGPGIGEAEAQRLHDIVVHEVRQLAFDGKLPIWGKRRGSSLWESVPQDFWQQNRLNYLTILRDEPSAILVERMPRYDRNDEWHELMTSWQAVEDLWPRT